MNHDTRAKIDRDLLVYGTAFTRKTEAGYEHLPAAEIITQRRLPGKPEEIVRPIDLLSQEIAQLELNALGELRRFINAEYEQRVRFIPGLTPEEAALPTKLHMVKAVRDRTGLGLVDSKNLVDGWFASRNHNKEGG